jgi:hypothetical protein
MQDWPIPILKKPYSSPTIAKTAWFIFAVAVVAFWALIGAARGQEAPVLPYVDERCAYSFSCQKDITYELIYQGEVVSGPEDMTREECEQVLADIEPQTEPFTELVCRPRLVEREKS